MQMQIDGSFIETFLNGESYYIRSLEKKTAILFHGNSSTSKHFEYVLVNFKRCILLGVCSLKSLSLEVQSANTSSTTQDAEILTFS